MLSSKASSSETSEPLIVHPVTEKPLPKPRKKAAPRKKSPTEKVQEETSKTTNRMTDVLEPNVITVSHNVSMPVPTSPLPVGAPLQSDLPIIILPYWYSASIPASSPAPLMNTLHPEANAPTAASNESANEGTQDIPSGETTSLTKSEGHENGHTPVASPEKGGRANWKTIKNSQYFSAFLKKQAEGLAAFDEEALISNMKALNDKDHQMMRNVLTQFHKCQDSIAKLEELPSEKSYSAFMTEMTGLFTLVESYVGMSPEAQNVRGSAAAAKTDTGIEKSTIGLRMKFLILQLKEMTSPLTLDTKYFHTTLPQLSAHRLFGMERHQEVLGYLKQAEKVYGSEGLKYGSPAKEGMVNMGRKIVSPVSTLNAMVGNVRSGIGRATLGTVLLSAEILGVGYAAYKTGELGLHYLRGGNVTAPVESTDPNTKNANPQQPLTNNAAQLALVAQEQKAIEKIFTEMTLKVKGDNLHLTFVDTGTLTLNSTLFVHMGEGGQLPSKFANPIGGNEYTIPLTPSEKLKGTKLLVSLQAISSVGARNFLVPKTGGKDSHKAIVLP